MEMQPKLSKVSKLVSYGRQGVDYYEKAQAVTKRALAKNKTIKEATRANNKVNTSKAVK